MAPNPVFPLLFLIVSLIVSGGPGPTLIKRQNGTSLQAQRRASSPDRATPLPNDPMKPQNPPPPPSVSGGTSALTPPSATTDEVEKGRLTPDGALANRETDGDILEDCINGVVNVNGERARSVHGHIESRGAAHAGDPGVGVKRVVGQGEGVTAGLGSLRADGNDIGTRGFVSEHMLMARGKNPEECIGGSIVSKDSALFLDESSRGGSSGATAASGTAKCNAAAEKAFARLAKARNRAAASSWGAVALSASSSSWSPTSTAKSMLAVEDAGGVEGGGERFRDDGVAAAWGKSGEAARLACNGMVSGAREAFRVTECENRVEQP